MLQVSSAKPVTFQELAWDTAYFGVTCAKAVLHQPLSRRQWDDLKAQFGAYQFLTIENRDSEPVNAQLIGTETTAFLADVNIQFSKEPALSNAAGTSGNQPESIKIHQALPFDRRIVELVDFPFSKFTADPQLARRGGGALYRQWLTNSFGRAEKFYALAEAADGALLGYVLYSYLSNVCTVELIAVADHKAKSGIGGRLMRAVELAALQHTCTEVRVGTQLRNLAANNFYHKCGYRQVGCHQVYHLWRV